MVDIILQKSKLLNIFEFLNMQILHDLKNDR